MQLELTSHLPDRYKLRGRITQVHPPPRLRRLMPPEITTRGKMGFGLPLATWFRGDLRGYLLDHIASPAARLNEYVRPDYVRRLVAAHMARQAENDQQFWALLTLELWLRNLPALSRPWESAPAEVEAVAVAR